MQNDCVFCKIVAGKIPSTKVYEDEDVLAFNDINPLAPIHVLVVPKKHIDKLVSAQKEDVMLLGKIQLAAAEVAGKLGIEKAFRVLNANGAGAGQSVFHLHYHVRGGWKGGAPEDK